MYPKWICIISSCTHAVQFGWLGPFSVVNGALNQQFVEQQKGDAAENVLPHVCTVTYTRDVSVGVKMYG